MTSPRLLPMLLSGAALALFIGACNGSDSSPTSGSTVSPTTNTATTQLRVVDLVVGTGATANRGSRITVSYGGWLYDASQPDGKGRQFDSNSAYTFTLGTRAVIDGWDQGIPGMQAGGQRRLIIPPSLGYNDKQVGPIPPNSTLLFDIRLISVG